MLHRSAKRCCVTSVALVLVICRSAVAENGLARQHTLGERLCAFPSNWFEEQRQAMLPSAQSLFASSSTQNSPTLIPAGKKSRMHTRRSSAPTDAAVNDLGGDCVILYSFDKSTGSLTENQSLQLPAGSGPRHAVFHPTLPLLYVACELSSTVVVCRQSAAEANIMLLEPSGIFSTVPEGVAAGASSCSAIRISLDGKMVFVANRGDDSIAVFEVSESPELVLKSFVRDFGSIPRDFALHPSLPILYVASQNDNLLTAFAIGPDGKATRLGESLSTPTPVCVVPFLA